MTIGWSMTLSWVFAEVTPVTSGMPSAWERVWILEPFCLGRPDWDRSEGPQMRAGGSGDTVDSSPVAADRGALEPPGHRVLKRTVPVPGRRENGIADRMSCPLEHCFIRLLMVLPHAAGCGGAEQRGRVTRLVLLGRLSGHILLDGQGRTRYGQALAIREALQRSTGVRFRCFANWTLLVVRLPSLELEFCCATVILFQYWSAVRLRRCQGIQVRGGLSVL